MPFESFFQLDANTRTRGHSVKLKTKSFHTELRQHFFSERVTNLWNSLDEETVTASSLNSFKKNLIRQRKHMSRAGQVICLWTYEAEPAPPGKASFGELSVSIMTSIQHNHTAHCAQLQKLVNTELMSFRHILTSTKYRRVNFLTSCISN